VARKHWAEVRKLLEQDLLCDSLKGRVRYFATTYRKAHDSVGRVCILVDDKEIINMHFWIEEERYAVIRERKRDKPGVSNFEIHKEVYADFADNGLFYPGDFGKALDEFLSSDIQVALQSKNQLVRMLAILDRRTGKRTLEKIKLNMTDLPGWLRYFYELRLESEKIYIR
jgi:hypothetical protein